MKKAFILFLLPIFLLTTTVGVKILSLYCGGKLTAKGFSVKPCCKDVNKGGCCKTESVSLKVCDSFLKTNDTYDTFSLTAVLNVIPSFLFKVPVPESINWSVSGNKAPPLSDTPLYLKYRSLII